MCPVASITRVRSGVSAGRDDAVDHRGRDDDVVARADLQHAEGRLDKGAAGLDVDALVADCVAVERRRLVGDYVRDPAVVVGHQMLAAEDGIGAGAVQLVSLEVARLERPVGRTGPRRRLVLLGGHDRGRQETVIQQRRVGGEPLLAHQLLGVERAVRLAELRVALGRQLADSAVVRHGSSFAAVAVRRPSEVSASAVLPDFNGNRRVGGRSAVCRTATSDNRTLLSAMCSVR